MTFKAKFFIAAKAFFLGGVRLVLRLKKMRFNNFSKIRNEEESASVKPVFNVHTKCFMGETFRLLKIQNINKKGEIIFLLHFTLWIILFHSEACTLRIIFIIGGFDVIV